MISQSNTIDLLKSISERMIRRHTHTLLIRVPSLGSPMLTKPTLDLNEREITEAIPVVAAEA